MQFMFSPSVILQNITIDTHKTCDLTIKWLNYTSTIPGNFEITPSGYILVKKALDAEDKSLYNLTIEAKDEGQPSRSNTVSKPNLNL